MKLRRWGAPPDDRAAAPDKAAADRQRICPQCGSIISAHAKTCLHCSADLVAIARAEAAKVKQLQRQQQEKRDDAALLPTRLIVVIVTALVVVAILALIVQGAQESARLALTPTITRTPTRTVTPTHTPQPSPTQAATPTIPPPLEYTVRSGDTPGGIAAFYDISVEELYDFNGKQSDDFIIPGEVLKIPVPTPKPTATPTPIGLELTRTPVPPTPAEAIYTVQQDDTLSDIAIKVKIPMDVIQRRNNIADPSDLQVGQQLIIPLGATPTFTPAPVPANATPTSPANYPAVKLLTPLDGEIIVGNAEPVLLQWLSVGVLRPNESYRAEVVQLNSTRPPLSIRTLATSWRLPLDLFPLPGDRDRVFRWQVEIVRQTGTGSGGQPSYSVVGQLSQYSFQWLAAAPTPTPTPTPR
jgi:LysM repeat protein